MKMKKIAFPILAAVIAVAGVVVLIKNRKAKALPETAG